MHATRYIFKLNYSYGNIKWCSSVCTFGACPAIGSNGVVSLPIILHTHSYDMLQNLFILWLRKQNYDTQSISDVTTLYVYFNACKVNYLQGILAAVNRVPDAKV